MARRDRRRLSRAGAGGAQHLRRHRARSLRCLARQESRARFRRRLGPRRQGVGRGRDQHGVRRRHVSHFGGDRLHRQTRQRQHRHGRTRRDLGQGDAREIKGSETHRRRRRPRARRAARRRFRAGRDARRHPPADARRSGRRRHDARRGPATDARRRRGRTRFRDEQHRGQRSPPLRFQGQDCHPRLLGHLVRAVPRVVSTYARGRGEI